MLYPITSDDFHQLALSMKFTIVATLSAFRGCAFVRASIRTARADVRTDRSAHAIELTRVIVREYFDQELRAKPSPLLGEKTQLTDVHIHPPRGAGRTH